MIGDPICCTHPRIILRRDITDLTTFYRRYVFGGRFYDLSSSNNAGLLYYPVIKELSRYGKEFSENHNWREICDEYKRLHSRYHLVSADGVCVPILMLVPCNCCELCLNRKSLDFVTRCDIETAYSRNSAFITLTYDDEHRPLDHGLYKHVAQRWIKRMRKYLDYRGFDGNEFKYFICGEYGSKTGREHYHAIIWNLPQDYMDQFSEPWKAFKHLVNETWCFKYKLYGDDGKPLKNENGGYVFGIDPFGFTHVGAVNSASLKYCAKYMRKNDCKMQGDRPAPFRLYSYRPTIGFQFVEDFIEYHRSHPTVSEIEYLNADGILKTVPMPAYFKNKFFPTKSKAMPYNIYDAYRAYHSAAFMYQSYLRAFIEDIDDRIQPLDVDDPFCILTDQISKDEFERFRKHFQDREIYEDFVLEDWFRQLFHKTSYKDSAQALLTAYESMCEHYDIIKDFDFDSVNKLLDISRERSEYLSCIPRETFPDPDIKLSILRARRARERDREIF